MYSPTESLLGALSCSRFHALSWWATVAGIKTLRMLDSVLDFSERACSCCASSSAGRGRGRLLLKRLHGRLVDTLELFFNHDGCRSGCDAFRRNIDTVPCQTKNFTDSHTACKGRVDSQLQMGIIANIKCEKSSRHPRLHVFGYSLRNRGMESWIFFHKLLLLLVFAGYLVAFVMHDEQTIISVNN